jgi:signal transduction histidine kinase/ActR/RegA family two-component response regulator
VSKQKNEREQPRRLDDSRIQQSLRDLMSLLALPALWAGRDGAGVLQLMTQAVERIVEMDMSYVNVPLLPNESPVITLRLNGNTANDEQIRLWQSALDAWESMPINAPAISCETPLGTLRVIRLSMGYSAQQGSVWFGAAEADFPVVTQLAFLRAAASMAATGLQAARTDHEREQASRAKDEFLAMLGHELRNPLAPITTALALIKRQSKEPFDKYHTIIERQVAQLSRLVDDLLDVSRITRGKIELRLERLRIGSVLARAVEAVEPLIEQREHQLVLDVSDEGAQITGDMTRLTQVFVNLLTNAAKFTDPGGAIHVTAQVVQDHIQVSIADNGAGIGADLMPRLFSIFEQGRTTIERSKGGLGIGLALVKNLVELHGGSVAVVSRGSGMGAHFTVTLPLAGQAGEHIPLTQPIAQLPLHAAHASVRVLLVDDNIDALESLQAYLIELGFNVAIACNPIQALNVAAEFNPNVAILDIGLPGMDGYQLAEELRHRQHERPLRLFALSGYGQLSDHQRSVAAGFEGHFVKPVALSDVLAALTNTSTVA